MHIANVEIVSVMNVPPASQHPEGMISLQPSCVGAIVGPVVDGAVVGICVVGSAVGKFVGL